MSPKVTPRPKKAHIPTYQHYKHIESIARTDNFQSPEALVILGSGPKGRDVWSLIKPGTVVWALNEGVNICIDHPKECPIIPAVWFVNDHNVLNELYFPKANKNFRGIRIFGDTTIKIVRQRYLYTRQQIDAVREGRLFSIPRGPFNKKEQDGWVHSPTMFKPGGTVCAAALWVAYIKGPAKRVYLCGVDMSKDIHYSSAKEPASPDPRHGEEWGTSRPALDKRIRHFKNLGMEIYTLSETKLRNVEQVEAIK